MYSSLSFLHNLEAKKAAAALHMFLVIPLESVANQAALTINNTTIHTKPLLTPLSPIFPTPRIERERML